MQPLKSECVEQRLKNSRRGKMSNSTWGERMRGEGEFAGSIGTMFRLFSQKLDFDGLPPLDAARFRPPVPRSLQLRLF